eukprot:COSAG06_NODE_116_length_23262_cov_47.854034_11_plen_115_part_00
MHIILYYAGITDTAIGGQRIEEYMLNDTSLLACSDRTGVKNPEWNGRLYGKQTLPFVDMTVKGWLWYQVSEEKETKKEMPALSPYDVQLMICQDRLGSRDERKENSPKKDGACE